jgi:hypothetical protein
LYFKNFKGGKMKKSLILVILGILCLGVVCADTCTDTDGGDDPYTIGTATTNGTYTDSCTLTGAGYALCTEYYCTIVGSNTTATNVSSKTYYCDSTTPTICSFTINTSTSYTDSDGGNTPLVAGYLTTITTNTFSFGVYNSSSIRVYDTCYTSGTYRGQLREYYLRSSGYTSSPIDCDAIYGSSYSCMTDASGYGYCGASEVCSNYIDDNSNGQIDTTGGCDTDGDGTIEYVCGCASYTTSGSGRAKRITIGSFVSYGSADTTCPSGQTYVCTLAGSSASNGSRVYCGEGEDIEGVYYEADSACYSSSGPSRAAGLEETNEGFWTRFWDWLTFWN